MSGPIIDIRNRPIVSIVIGNYNYASYIGDAIESALGQSYQNVEVIVVDDGSVDSSREVIATFGKRIQTILKENGGMGSTANAGFSVSRGEVVIFLDSDDCLSPDAVETALEPFRSIEVAKVHWPLLEIDGSGNLLGGIVPAKSLRMGNVRDDLVQQGPDAYLSPPTSGNAWSRAFLEKVLPIPEEDFRQHADMYLATLAGIYGSICAIDRPLGFYRIHGQNDYAGLSAAEKTRRNIAVYEIRCRILEEHLHRAGIPFDPEMWRSKGSAFDWMNRVQRFTEQLEEVVPVGATYILVDDAQLGDRWGGSEIVRGRTSLPFLEHGGVYWGPPSDDAIGLSELKRMQGAGAGFLVLAWPSFWWRDTFPLLFHHLETTYPRRVDNESLVIYDISDTLSA